MKEPAAPQVPYRSRDASSQRYASFGKGDSSQLHQTEDTIPYSRVGIML